MDLEIILAGQCAARSSTGHALKGTADATVGADEMMAVYGAPAT